ncbi:hypothetical protein BDP27DRAFT_1343795 [Rhodocollybia butyracea]|uniref:Uncharacterized protein n=1 Tax=Rhodocollybia butyracea TaxID=206335 RepID=A0A9P5TYI7_9AGAR|nr:hypothetical protein BDP27DRAFT_1343795 [Rhodocollybia butyracea]
MDRITVLTRRVVYPKLGFLLPWLVCSRVQVRSQFIPKAVLLVTSAPEVRSDLGPLSLGKHPPKLFEHNLD